MMEARTRPRRRRRKWYKDKSSGNKVIETTINNSVLSRVSGCLQRLSYPDRLWKHEQWWLWFDGEDENGLRA